jgi:hypothetical protein
MHLPSMTFEEINNRCCEFYSNLHKKFINPHQSCEYLNEFFNNELQTYVLTSWVPDDNNQTSDGSTGGIIISFSDPGNNEKRGAVKTLKLCDFIYQKINPIGVYLLERVLFELEG